MTQNRNISSTFGNKDLLPPEKFFKPLSGKLMLILFFNSKGNFILHWIPWKQTVNGVYYANTLTTHLWKIFGKED
jgi:hypothetical protein